MFKQIVHFWSDFRINGQCLKKEVDRFGADIIPSYANKMTSLDARVEFDQSQKGKCQTQANELDANAPNISSI